MSVKWQFDLIICISIISEISAIEYWACWGFFVCNIIFEFWKQSCIPKQTTRICMNFGLEQIVEYNITVCRQVYVATWLMERSKKSEWPLNVGPPQQKHSLQIWMMEPNSKSERPWCRKAAIFRYPLKKVHVASWLVEPSIKSELPLNVGSPATTTLAELMPDAPQIKVRTALMPRSDCFLLPCEKIFMSLVHWCEAA